MLKANNTCTRQAFGQSSLNSVSRTSQGPRRHELRNVTLWHRDTSQHTVSGAQTERQRVAKKRDRKARGYVVTATRGRSGREREKRVVIGAEQRRAFRDMLRDYTYRYNTLCSELRQSSSRRERQRIEIVRSSAERNTMLGQVSMRAARRNFTGSPRHRDHM